MSLAARILADMTPDQFASADTVVKRGRQAFLDVGEGTTIGRRTNAMGERVEWMR